MTTQEHELSPVKRKALALLMALPPAGYAAMMELMLQWENGAGPDKEDKAACDVWLRNKVDEIKARDKAARLAGET